MKDFMFKVVFTDAKTGETRTMIKEYRAGSREEAESGITDYIMDNKTIQTTHDVTIFEEIEK
ncbi:hypothetical protein [Aeromonas phage 65.2]|uniref:Uncharacterized protein n=1 Tax=Aeromonas phage 65.2 TaxID=1932896 RepID=A0A219YCH1_9CAUD|nr:hypothetical protein [Aeromonas phage 65.2]